MMMEKSGEHARSTIAEESYVYVFSAGDINFAARRGEWRVFAAAVSTV